MTFHRGRAKEWSRNDCCLSLRERAFFRGAKDDNPDCKFCAAPKRLTAATPPIAVALDERVDDFVHLTTNFNEQVDCLLLKSSTTVSRKVCGPSGRRSGMVN